MKAIRTAQAGLPLLRRWQQAFDARSQRERLLLSGVALALGLLVGDALWLSPAITRWKASRLQQDTAQAALESLNLDVRQLQQRRMQQARQQRDELNALRQRVRDGETVLRSFESTLVGPDRMIELLDHVLAGQSGLKLRAMRSLGRQDLLAPAGAALPAAAALPANVAPVGNAPAPAPAAATPAAGAARAPGLADPALATLYRHGVELQIEGGFADLLTYLQTLEAMPQRVLWGGVSLKVDQYPKSVLTLRLYTISRDRHWLEI